MCRQIAVGIDGAFRKAGRARSIKDGRLVVGIDLLRWQGNWRKAFIIGAGTDQFFERNRTAQIARRPRYDDPVQFLDSVQVRLKPFITLIVANERAAGRIAKRIDQRSEEHTYELQSLMRI